jgi:hypothetical protein
VIIKISRSGGFAGIEESIGTINTSNLQEKVAARVEDSVAEVSRLLNETEGYSPVGSDMLQYEVEITDARGVPQKLVLVDEGDDQSPIMKAFYQLLDVL